VRFIGGKKPQWKGKPKTSPLDTDVEFLKLRTTILGGKLKPFEFTGIEVYEEQDSKRLKTKNPARLVRDHLRRILREANLEPDYSITCRETSTPGVWAVVVTHEPREMAVASGKSQ
jgi:hypothetical protein